MTRHGFSILELSIVLVIIALLSGGIFLGVDLIKSSSIRAQISQIDKMNSGVRTFSEKYGGLPGDLQSTIAVRAMFATGNDTVGSADGNGFLEKCAAVNSLGTSNGYGCETGLFWRQLANAQLVEGPFATSICAGEGTQTGNCGAAIALGAMPNFLPQAKIGGDTFVFVAADVDANYFQIGGVTAISGAGVYTLTNSLTPMEASSMDTKWDDGKPQSGNVLAMGNTACGTDGPGCAAAVAPDQCVAVVGGQNAYNITSARAESKLCELRVDFY